MDRVVVDALKNLPETQRFMKGLLRLNPLPVIQANAPKLRFTPKMKRLIAWELALVCEVLVLRIL